MGLVMVVASIWRGRAFFGLLAPHPIYLSLLCIYIHHIFSLQFQNESSFALIQILLAKFRHADGIAILQCFGCQTPMKCIQCQGVPCGPMQGSILLRCPNVMFQHNKCPTRPPYPCIRLHSLYVCTVFSILSVHSSTENVY